MHFGAGCLQLSKEDARPAFPPSMQPEGRVGRRPETGAPATSQFLELQGPPDGLELQGRWRKQLQGPAGGAAKCTNCRTWLAASSSGFLFARGRCAWPLRVPCLLLLPAAPEVREYERVGVVACGVSWLCHGWELAAAARTWLVQGDPGRGAPERQQCVLCAL
jgi:hypothetical protein